MKRWGWWLAGLGMLISLAHLFLHDPEKGGFLSCPFRVLTGLLCPGCGSQRAVHDLMHLRIPEALAHNALLVLSIPLLGLQYGYTLAFPQAKPLSARNRVVWGWTFLVVGWAILRNLPFWTGTGY